MKMFYRSVQPASPLGSKPVADAQVSLVVLPDLNLCLNLSSKVPAENAVLVSKLVAVLEIAASDEMTMKSASETTSQWLS